MNARRCDSGRTNCIRRHRLKLIIAKNRRSMNTADCQ